MTFLLTVLLWAQTTEMVVKPRTPIAIQLSTPAAEPTRLAPRDILDATAAVFERETDLAPLIIQAEDVAECGGRLACLSARARERAPIDHLLVVSLLARPNAVDLVSALLVSAEPALACERDQPAAVELCAAERAVVAELARAELPDVDRLGGMLAQAIAAPLDAHWQKTGTIDLSLAVAGARVEVDGADLGQLPSQRLRLTQVPSGRRSIRASYGDTSVIREIEVTHGETSLSIDHADWHAESTSRTALFWSGVGAMAIGSAIAIWSIAFAATNEAECYFDDCGFDLITLEQMFRDSGDGRGSVLALPLGYSLAGAGVAWSAGAKLGDAEVPWLEAIIGLGIAVVAYGASAIIDAAI